MTRAMYGLMKIQNAMNTDEAWKDWGRLYQIAKDRGLLEQANELHPGMDAGWRTIDKRIAALKVLLEIEPEGAR